MDPTSKIRCAWCGTDPLYCTYHDEEWGVPSHDDRHLFEKLILDGAQAGLSWITILRKRESYRAAYENFDVRKVARFTPAREAKLMLNPGIVRNRQKIASSVTNARNFIAIQEEFGTFDKYLWRFVDGKPLINHWKSIKEVPATSKESDALSKDLKKRGFKFVGSTIIYAFMQAAGLINDHTTDCFRHSALAKKR